MSSLTTDNKTDGPREGRAGAQRREKETATSRTATLGRSAGVQPRRAV